MNATAGSVMFTVTCSPQVWPEQQVSLLLGDQNIPATPVTVPTGSLTFTATLVAGTYYVRLRVDGVASFLINRSLNPPQFDATQKVTIT